MRTRKMLKAFCGIVVLLLFCEMSFGQTSEAKVLNKRVEAVRIDLSSLHLALSELASKYGIPIGLETIKEDGLESEEKITIDVPEGTIKDVLDAIIQAAPRYEWEVVDGVINVLPKENRDSFLKGILDTSIKEFTIKPGQSKISVRGAITNLPEVKEKLKAANVSPLNLEFVSTEFAKLSESFSLDARNKTVRSILNQIIRKSNAKYWLVSRFGKKQEFLIINL